MGSEEMPTEQGHPKNRHPHALKKRLSQRTLDRQRRQRKALFVVNALTTLLFVGASLGWGPMQLMVCTKRNYERNIPTASIDPQQSLKPSFQISTDGNQWIFFQRMHPRRTRK
jgi:hypothetical protein